MQAALEQCPVQHRGGRPGDIAVALGIGGQPDSDLTDPGGRLEDAEQRPSHHPAVDPQGVDASAIRGRSVGVPLEEAARQLLVLDGAAPGEPGSQVVALGRHERGELGGLPGLERRESQSVAEVEREHVRCPFGLLGRGRITSVV